jgi:hypothetical protein
MFAKFFKFFNFTSEVWRLAFGGWQLALDKTCCVGDVVVVGDAIWVFYVGKVVRVSQWLKPPSESIKGAEAHCLCEICGESSTGGKFGLAKSFGGDGGSGGGIDIGSGRNDAVDVVVAVENGWLFFSFTTIDGC